MDEVLLTELGQSQMTEATMDLDPARPIVSRGAKTCVC